MRAKIIGLSIALLLVVLYGGLGCDTGQKTTGTLRLNLTDAPGQHEEVYITFTEVSVHRGEAQDNCTDNATDNCTALALKKDNDNGNGKGKDTDNQTDLDNATDQEGWLVISDQEQGFDLLKLQDGKFDLLAESELAAGVYTQIRLKITDGLDNESDPKTYVKVDGEKHPLIVPSGTKSGLKLVHPFTITADNETVLYLDFDAEESVNQTGSGTYKLKPTIKVLTDLPQS